jgi:hypothetical protein
MLKGAYYHKPQHHQRYKYDASEAEYISPGDSSENDSATSSSPCFETSSVESISDDVLTSERSEKGPLLGQTSAGKRNDTSESRTLNIHSAGGHVSNYEAGASPPPAVFPLPTSRPSPVNVSSHEVLSTSAEVSSSPKGVMQRDHITKKYRLDVEGRSDVQYDHTATARQRDLHREESRYKMEVQSEDEEFQSYSQQTEQSVWQLPVPGRRPSYNFNNQPQEGHETYFNLVLELECELEYRKGERRRPDDRIPPHSPQYERRHVSHGTCHTTEPSTSTHTCRVNISSTLPSPDTALTTHNVTDVSINQSTAQYVSSDQQHVRTQFQQVRETDATEDEQQSPRFHDQYSRSKTEQDEKQ